MWKKTLMAIAALLVAAELVARFYFGLGDPPLSVADPEIEYLFKPAASYSRHGNYIRYNAHSMRSMDFGAKKRRGEFRVMVFGDSVVNGGSYIDQQALATSRLEIELAQRLRRYVVVGNISAGSWGPPNMLAYARRFGLFEADVVVLVLSSHDYQDAPTFEPRVGVDPAFRSTAPVLALQELVERALYRPAPSRAPTSADTESSLQALRELIRMAKPRARVIVAQHLEVAELKGTRLPGFEAIAEVARSEGAQLVDLGPAFAAASDNPYRDGIHPNARGQRIIADRLMEAIRGDSPAS